MTHIVRDITYISRCGMQYRNQQLEDLDLTGRQAGSLLVICHNPGISQDRLARIVVLNKSNITRQLAVLEEKGFVERTVSPTDKRVLQLRPTEKTMELLPRIREVYRQWRDHILQDLTEDEQQLLESLLERIKGRAYEWLDGGGAL